MAMKFPHVQTGERVVNSAALENAKRDLVNRFGDVGVGAIVGSGGDVTCVKVLNVGTQTIEAGRQCTFFSQGTEENGLENQYDTRVGNHLYVDENGFFDDCGIAVRDIEPGAVGLVRICGIARVKIDEVVSAQGGYILSNGGKNIQTYWGWHKIVSIDEDGEYAKVIVNAGLWHRNRMVEGRGTATITTYGYLNGDGTGITFTQVPFFSARRQTVVGDGGTEYSVFDGYDVLRASGSFLFSELFGGDMPYNVYLMQFRPEKVGDGYEMKKATTGDFALYNLFIFDTRTYAGGKSLRGVRLTQNYRFFFDV